MEKIDVKTTKHAEMCNITDAVREIVQRSRVRSGVAHIFVPHTTAGITLNEHADPDVVTDVMVTLEHLVPWKQAHFRHAEGNSAAHVRASLAGSSVQVFIENGELALGTWQGIFFCEFDGPRSRQVWVKVQAD